MLAYQKKLARYEEKVKTREEDEAKRARQIVFFRASVAKLCESLGEGFTFPCRGAIGAIMVQTIAVEMTRAARMYYKNSFFGRVRCFASVKLHQAYPKWPTKLRNRAANYLAYQMVKATKDTPDFGSLFDDEPKGLGAPAQDVLNDMARSLLSQFFEGKRVNSGDPSVIPKIVRFYNMLWEFQQMPLEEKKSARMCEDPKCAVCKRWLCRQKKFCLHPQSKLRARFISLSGKHTPDCSTTTTPWNEICNLTHCEWFPGKDPNITLPKKADPNDLIEFPKRSVSNNHLSTDGLQCRFLVNAKEKGPPPDADERVTLQSIDELVPGMYIDAELYFLTEEHVRLLIGVDPGRAYVVSVVRGIRSNTAQPDLELIEAPEAREGMSKTAKRKLAHKKKLLRKGQEIYALKASRWADMSHRTAAQKRLARRQRTKGLDQVYEALKQYSRKSPRPDDIAGYIRCFATHYEALDKEAFARQVRKTRSYCFQQTHRALKQVLREICGDRNPSECVLLWGNGNFSPSFGKGYAPTPNKKLYRYCSQFLPVILCDERNTSKKSFCCTEEVTHPPHNTGRRRRGKDIRGISICSNCNRFWARDIGSALKIGDDAMKRMCKRESNDE